ncbi:MAG: hypothetical protein GEV03_20675 [Streptosporangiales bacterium]|nr:hypothetical protein [Streptosporangiales bacterium]
MDLMRYADNLRHQLAVAAEAGGEDARVLAERLTAPLESAIRVTLLDVLSAAADEITRDLAPGSVDLRLRGGDPSFVVTPPPADQPFDESDPEPDGIAVSATGVRSPGSPDDEGAMSRINLRLPEHLKVRVEETAGREGLSVNTWLVRAAAAALERDDRGRRPERRAPRGGQRYTGWVR